MTPRQINGYLTRVRKITDKLTYGYNPCVAALQENDKVKFLYRGVNIVLPANVINEYSADHCANLVKKGYTPALFMKETGEDNTGANSSYIPWLQQRAKILEAELKHLNKK